MKQNLIVCVQIVDRIMQSQGKQFMPLYLVSPNHHFKAASIKVLPKILEQQIPGNQWEASWDPYLSKVHVGPETSLTSIVLGHIH